MNNETSGYWNHANQRQVSVYLVGADSGKRIWYPPIISPGSGELAGQNARLYFPELDSSEVARRFIAREITFQRD